MHHLHHGQCIVDADKYSFSLTGFNRLQSQFFGDRWQKYLLLLLYIFINTCSQYVFYVLLYVKYVIIIYYTYFI